MPCCLNDKLHHLQLEHLVILEVKFKVTINKLVILDQKLINK